MLPFSEVTTFIVLLLIASIIFSQLRLSRIVEQLESHNILIGQLLRDLADISKDITKIRTEIEILTANWKRIQHADALKCAELEKKIHELRTKIQLALESNPSNQELLKDVLALLDFLSIEIGKCQYGLHHKRSTSDTT
jgi:chromosome segregation ATPase